MLYIKCSNSSFICDSGPIWIDEWARRRNGDKYQTITPDVNIIYNLSNYSLKAGSNVNVNVTHAVVYVVVNKSVWCPDNINFFISFHESEEDASDAKCKFGPQSFVSLKQNGTVYAYVVKLEAGKEICLNELCDDIQPQKW
jgi:hypothetical protein